MPITQTATSLLYWRKSPINGFRCVPIILKLTPEGTLSMRDKRQVVVFEVPVTQVAARFTGWGTMILTMNGQRYDIVGMPARVSPSPSPAQYDEVMQAARQQTGLDKDHSIGIRSIKDWYSVFAKQGSATGSPKMKAMKYFLYTVGAVVLILAILVVIGILSNPHN